MEVVTTVETVVPFVIVAVETVTIVFVVVVVARELGTHKENTSKPNAALCAASIAFL